ncbi:MAG: hypothetical protein KBG46_09110 [Paracoccus sp.]|nr:hypothetical protein [Paracoccus sp. (in: a-proteobacteria)]
MSLRPCIPAMLFVVMLVLAGGMAQAAPDYAGRVVRQLADQGYRQIEVRRSLLGKVIVTGSRPGQQREIVIDPRNGELLRDLVRQGAGAPVAAGTVSDSSGHQGRGRGRGGSNDADDDDNSDDDDDRGGGRGSSDDDDDSGGGRGGNDGDGDGSDDSGSDSDDGDD